MESLTNDMNKISISEPSEVTLINYEVSSKVLDSPKMFTLPSPKDIKKKLELNISEFGIEFNEKTFNTYKKEGNKLDLTSINSIQNKNILYSIILMLGGMNEGSDSYVFVDETDENENSLIDDSEKLQFENSANYLIYYQKLFLFFIFKKLELKDLDYLFDSLDQLGLIFNNRKENTFYKQLKEFIYINNKILVIVAPSDNFWIKSSKLEIGNVGFDIKMNNYDNLYINKELVKKFCNKIIKHPRCKFGVISSKVRKNIKKGLDAINMFVANWPDNNEIITFAQEHHFNYNLVDKKTKQKPEFVRDLKKICDYIKNSKNKEIDENHILILESEKDKIIEDNDDRISSDFKDKVKSTKNISIQMKLFSEAYIEYPEAEKIKFSKIEDAFLDYICNLLDNCTTSVETYLKENPFEVKL